jgi:enoyl-[acyl-carrier protein] reductase I
MVPIDFSGKVALVTGVGDNKSFAWYIGKALQHAGAKVALTVEPRRLDIIGNLLTSSKPEDAEARKLPDGSEFKPVKLVRCDANYDTMADVKLEEMSDVNRRHYAKYTEDYSISGAVAAAGAEFGGIDILVHSMAFAPEITKPLIETSRKGYNTAMGIGAYSLVSLVRAAAPFMANRPGGASVVGLTYVAGDRVVPHYGGGMGTVKAALQMDAKQLAWFVGDKNIRVNLISAGPYASRAARAINPDFDKLIGHAAEHSPLRRPIEPEEVADATVFLCSPLAAAVTGQILYVDCGYNVMGT